MGLAVAIQMDPMETINIDGDTSFVLALEAQARGHALYHYLPTHLSLRDGRLRARGRRLEVRRERGRHHSFGEYQTLDLAAMDVVLMRQDPPFDMAYITATHLLEHVHPTTLVVNDPASVRNAPEKLFVTRFEGLMPPTLITSDRGEILSFRAEHGDIIVKPLKDCTEEEYDRIFDTNTKGVFFTLREAARRAKDGGRIIVTSTGGTRMFFPDQSLYLGSKGAIEQFVRCVSWEIGKRRITADSLGVPGRTPPWPQPPPSRGGGTQ